MKYIITTIVPILLTGIVTGIVSNIQQRNTDKSKKEVAYDKVYYPLYTYLRGKMYEDINIEDMIRYIGEILKRNDKYISNTTKIYFEHYLRTVNNNRTSKACPKAYERLVQHILDYNWRLRYNLGYVRGSFWEVFASFSEVLKTLFFLVVLLLICDVLAVTYIFFKNNVILILLSLFVLCFVGTFIVLVIFVIKDYLYNRMIKKKKTRSENKDR